MSDYAPAEGAVYLLGGIVKTYELRLAFVERMIALAIKETSPADYAYWRGVLSALLKSGR